MSQYYQENLTVGQRFGRGEVTVITCNFVTVEVTEALNAVHLQAMFNFGFRQLFSPVISKGDGPNSSDLLVYNFERIGDSQ